MKRDSFFHDSRLPFALCRYTRDSGETFKPHLHRWFSIGAVVKGDSVFRIGGNETLLQTGVLALVNPDNLHSCNCSKTESRSFYMLHLEVEWCLKIQQSLWQNISFVPVDCITAKDPDLYTLFIETAEVMTGTSHLLEKEQFLVTLAEAVFARCCHPAVPTGERAGDVALLKEWLATDLIEDLTVNDFASERNVNPYTLLRHFRESYGVTPYAFRMNCRIEQGRRLLQKGMEIGDVAQLCGFFDQSHFHRHFKAMTSSTPHQYKASFLSQ